MTETTTTPPPGSRIGAILMQPTAEWTRIDAEQTDVREMFVKYAVPLAAIGPACALIGGQLFPMTVLGVVLRTPLVGAVIAAVVSYVMALVSVFVLGLIIDALAPSFGAVKDRRRAMAVAIFSSIAAWVAGVFGLLPMLAVLSIVGLYSLFLLYKGLPIVMKVPQDKAMAYTVTTIVAAIVLWVVVAMVVGAVTSIFAAGALGAAGLAGI